MITLKNVSKAYSKDKKAVDNLSLEIKNGEIFGFLGPNGAGKSTTIKMVTGILKADAGEVLIDQCNIDTQPLDAKAKFGYVSDNPDLFLNLKGIEFLNFLADIYDVKNRQQKIERLCEQFGMKEVLNDQMQSYSHGMRQKMMLCGALIHDPANWILDEPMVGLDPSAAFELKNMMRAHADKGNCVFFSTHTLEVAEKVCDRIGIINKGKLVFVGTMSEMKEHFNQNASLEDLFLEITQSV